MNAVEYAFRPFTVNDDSAQALAVEEQSYLAQVKDIATTSGVEISCLRLTSFLNPDETESKRLFCRMLNKLLLVAGEVGCAKVSFQFVVGDRTLWLNALASLLEPLACLAEQLGIQLLVSNSTPAGCQGKSLHSWQPPQPQDYRDLLAHCPYLGLSLSPADLAWQGIDYLNSLALLAPAIRHMEANDFEISRDIVKDSGLFGPLWWRYRLAGQGQLDWGQIVEALKLYGFQETLSIRLDDEFLTDEPQILQQRLQATLDEIGRLIRF